MTARLRGPYRIYVLATDEPQFRWALEQVGPADQERMVRIRNLAGLRGLKLERGDEMWVLGYPDTDGYDSLRFAVQWLQMDTPHRVILDRECETCGSRRAPWAFRRPERGGVPEARLKRCRDCEAAAQRERHEARKVKHFTPAVPDEATPALEDIYADELARYLARRKAGRVRL